MTTHKSTIKHRAVVRPGGASFYRKASSIGVAACFIGGSLLAASPASAAEIGWAPVPTTSVVGSPGEDGANGHSDISSLGVWPGDQVEYNINVDLSLGADAVPVTSLSVIDQLPDGFVVDERSLRVVGDNALALAPTSDYETTVEDSTLTVDFTEEWIAAHVGADATTPVTRLAISFTVTVAEDAAAYSSQANVATQVVNGEVFDSEPATILVPGVEPSETVTGINGEAVGDRVAVHGDLLNYSVKLDGTFAEDVDGEAQALPLAYDVSAFGIVEDYDERALAIDTDFVRVLDADGNDVTALFTVTASGGVLSVLAVADGPRGSVPESVLGQDYTVEYQGQVRHLSEDTDIVGSTVQLIDDVEHVVDAEASVAAQSVSPTKSAVSLAIDAIEGEEGTEGSPAVEETVLESVIQDSEFAYKLGSSALPANRLAPVQLWAIADSYTSGDRALHEWQVVADTDILGTNGEVFIAAGDVLGEPGNTEYFVPSFAGDNSGITATETFLEVVNTDAASELSWSAYFGATRTANEGTRVSNTPTSSATQLCAR